VKNENKIFIFIAVIVLMLIILYLIQSSNSNLGMEKILENPEVVIGNLYKAIDIVKENGKYKCCIEPACTMCYLGHWKFKEGTCFCDDAIKEGRDDDVCPECVSGIEKGLCTSSKEKGCEI
jgi:hypothetical protein